MPARYIDLHALQAVPAALLNRGEDNEPKTFELGGEVRSMVSSQCWKRRIRLDLEEELDEYAARTRRLPHRVADALHADGWPKDLANFAGTQVIRSATKEGLKTEPRQDGITQAMIFLPRDVIDEMAALCQRHRPDLEKAAAEQNAPTPPTDNKKAENTTPEAVLPTKKVAELIGSRTASVNLFGRMLAELPSAHVDGAVHLAHAFTVHASDRQPNFFTAVEEWPKPGDRGSAHLQTAFFATGVLYRYATVNLTELTHNLRGNHQQARDLLALFAEAFIMSLPQAKRTSTAPHTLPYLVHYVVRDRRPVSYAAAFEQPVRKKHGGGYTEPAAQALADHAAALNRLIGTRHRIAHGHATVHDKAIDQLGHHHASFEDLIDACTAAACTTTSSPGAA